MGESFSVQISKDLLQLLSRTLPKSLTGAAEKDLTAIDLAMPVNGTLFIDCIIVETKIDL